MEPIFLGIAIIGVGLLMIFFGIRKSNRCSARVVGRITGIHEDVTTDDEGYHSYSYSPEFEYEVNGTVYRGSGGRAYSKQNKIQIGGNIDIYYNPRNPQEHLSKGSKGALPIVGIAVIFLGVIYSYFALNG